MSSFDINVVKRNALELKPRRPVIGRAKDDKPDAIANSSPAPHADVLFVPLSDDNAQVDQVLLHVTLE